MRTSLPGILFLILMAGGAASASEPYSSLEAGYMDGFYLKTPDNKFLLKVGSRLNFGYTAGFPGSQPNFSSFDLYHAKIYAGGNVYTPSLQFYVQAAGATQTRGPSLSPAPESANGSFTLEDYYIRFLRPEWNVQFGQFKVPYAREWITYSGNLNFVDRSLATRFFTLGRDRGIALNSDRNTFAISMGVFNGGGNPILGTGFQPNSLNTNGENVSNDVSGRGFAHLVVVRAVASPMGPAGYSEGDVENSEMPKFDFGAGFTYDRNRDVALGGALVATRADIWSASADAVFKSAGTAVQSEFFYRRVNTPGAVTSMGFYVQPSVFIHSNKLELAARFGWLEPDTNVTNDTNYEAAAAWNLYLFGDHREKTQLQYTWRRQEASPAGHADDSFIDLAFQFTI
ncbi:MAG: porin [Pseudomonadota bacterium]